MSAAWERAEQGTSSITYALGLKCPWEAYRRAKIPDLSFATAVLFNTNETAATQPVIAYGAGPICKEPSPSASTPR